MVVAPLALHCIINGICSRQFSLFILLKGYPSHFHSVSQKKAFGIRSRKWVVKKKIPIARLKTLRGDANLILKL